MSTPTSTSTTWKQHGQPHPKIEQGHKGDLTRHGKATATKTR